MPPMLARSTRGRGSMPGRRTGSGRRTRERQLLRATPFLVKMVLIF